MPKPVVSWTIGAVAVTVVGAGLLTAAQAVDNSPDPQVVLTDTTRGADDGPRVTARTAPPTPTPTSIDDRGGRGRDGTTAPTTATTVDDRGGDGTTAPTTATTVDDRGGTSGGHGGDGTTSPTTATTVDDRGGTSGGHGSDD